MLWIGQEGSRRVGGDEGLWQVFTSQATPTPPDSLKRCPRGVVQARLRSRAAVATMLVGSDDTLMHRNVDCVHA
eukprot:1121614-Rhodomonas_salina.3